MSESNFNKLFANRLRYYMDLNDLNQKDIAERLHVSSSTVSNWYNGVKIPRMDTIDEMCKILHCKRSDLIASENQPEYLLDEDSGNIAQFVYNNPEYLPLFEAAKNVKKEDIEFITGLIERLNK